MTEDRQREFTELLRRTTLWAHASPEIRAVAAVGSWARGEQRMHSDVDLVIVVNDAHHILAALQAACDGKPSR